MPGVGAKRHESQYHWVCTCSHETLVAISDSTSRKLDKFLQAATATQQAIRRTVNDLAKVNGA